MDEVDQLRAKVLNICDQPGRRRVPMGCIDAGYVSENGQQFVFVFTRPANQMPSLITTYDNDGNTKTFSSIQHTAHPDIFVASLVQPVSIPT